MIKARQIAALAFGCLLAGPVSAETKEPAGKPVETRHTDVSVSNENREIVRRAFEAWADGEAVFDTLLADDVVWTIVGSDPVADVYHGRADFVERASRPLVSRLATPIVPEVHAIWAEGDTVIVRFDGSATTTSGASYRNQFVWIFHMENGQVTRAEAFLDLSAYRKVVDNNEPIKR